MRIAKVIGTVTLSRIHPSLKGARLKVVEPMSLEEGGQWGESSGDLVAYDDMGAGVGDRIMLSEGGEAAQPFFPESKPVDAYNAGILDVIDVDPDRTNND